MHHHVPVYGSFWKFSVPWVCSRCSHLENGALFSCFLYLAAFLGVWVLLVYCGALDFLGDDLVRGAMLGLTVDTGLATVLGFLEEFHIFSTSTWARILAFFLLQNGEVCSVDASI